MPSKNISAIASCFIFSVISFNSSAAADNIAVEVTGSGQTVYAAQQDAIRTGLQRVVPQLIFAERKIINDQMLTDSIMSSMNGFIEKLEIIDQHQASNDIQLKIRLHVSPRSVGSYVNQLPGKGVSIDMRSMLANANRREANREFREAYLLRFLRGLPSRAIEARVSDIHIDAADSRYAHVTTETQINPEFVANLISAARSIQCTPELEEVDACSETKICFETFKKRSWFLPDGWGVECIRLAEGRAVGVKYAYQHFGEMIGTASKLTIGLIPVTIDGRKLAPNEPCFSYLAHSRGSIDSKREVDPASREVGNTIFLSTKVFRQVDKIDLRPLSTLADLNQLHAFSAIVGFSVPNLSNHEYRKHPSMKIDRMALISTVPDKNELERVVWGDISRSTAIWFDVLEPDRATLSHESTGSFVITSSGEIDFSPDSLNNGAFGMHNPLAAQSLSRARLSSKSCPKSMNMN